MIRKTCETEKNNNFTFGIVVCEQLNVKLLSEGCQVRRHHTAGGQVDLVTAGLHLEQERVHRQKTGSKWDTAKALIEKYIPACSSYTVISKPDLLSKVNISVASKAGQTHKN